MEARQEGCDIIFNDIESYNEIIIDVISLRMCFESCQAETLVMI